MNRMETVPNELNLVKNVADFRLIRGKTITTKKRGTFRYNDYHHIIILIDNCREHCPAGRVLQYWVGSGRVLDKIPGSGSGSGRVGVSKNTIGYLFYFQLFPGLPIYESLSDVEESRVWFASKNLTPCRMH